MNVVVNGLMTNYQKTGSGDKTLVLLHGWGDSANTFSEIVKNLKGNYTIYGLDLPGFGGSEAPKIAWDLQDYANFVEAWLQKIAVYEVYAFIGHSYGGALLISGLGTGKLKSDKLVLLASAGIRNKNKLRKSSMLVLAKTAKVPLLLLPKNTRQRIKQKAYKKIGSDMLLLPNMQKTFKKIIKDDVQALAEKIKIPTLLIYGTNDTQTPLSYGQALNSALKNSKIEVIEEAGHFLHKEQPEKVGELMDDFLENKNA